MPPQQQKDDREALKAWTGALACPACQQPLRLGTDEIVCTACNRTYPILEGIPVLIADSAETPLPSPPAQDAESS